MYDLLDLLADMDRPPEERIANQKPPEPRRFECGRHLYPREGEAHVAECWRHVCPGCGERVANAFLMGLNHTLLRWGDGRAICGSIALRLNHLTYAIRNGQAPDARDLTVLDLGYLIGPDGSQIAPDGAVSHCRSPHEAEQLFAKWQSDTPGAELLDAIKVASE